MNNTEIMMLARVMPGLIINRAVAAGDEAEAAWRVRSPSLPLAKVQAAKSVAIELSLIADGALAFLRREPA